MIEAGQAERVSEGLRAGLGLGLRGDAVSVILTGEAARFAGGGGDARIERALCTLAELGRPVEVLDACAAEARVRAARAVEVWTSPATGPRRLRVGGEEVEIGPGAARFRRGGGRADAGRAIDAAELVAQILGSDGPVVLR